MDKGIYKYPLALAVMLILGGLLGFSKDPVVAFVLLCNGCVMGGVSHIIYILTRK